MSFAGGAFEDRRAQREALDDPLRREVAFREFASDLLLLVNARPRGLHVDGDRLLHANCIRECDLAATGESAAHHLQCCVSGGVCGGAIHLGGVLPAERATTVVRHAAVRVGDHLSSGEARVGERSARDESPRRIHVRHRLRSCVRLQDLERQCGEHRADVLDLHIRRMLRREDEGRYHG